MRLLAGILVGLMLAAGCSNPGPGRLTIDSEVFPAEPVELRETPFFPQEAYQCGPAALATVLGMTGLEVMPAELAPKVYLPARKGSLQIELIAAVRRYGRLPYRINPDVKSLLAELRAGRPVLVLQNLGLTSYPVWHYAVVIGFVPGNKAFILRSGTHKREILSATSFIRTWERGGFWGLVVLRPGELPARPEQSRYSKAVAALEAAGQLEAAVQAYAAGLEQWPDSALLQLGLGNTYYGEGRLTEAEAAFRKLVALHPRHAVGHNNLAQVLNDRGCYDAALAAVDTAVAVSHSESELRAAFHRTRSEILANQRAFGSAANPCEIEF